MYICLVIILQMKILIIEDDKNLSQSIGKGLRQVGYDVEICGDGIRGMEMAATEGFDLILLDLMLPGINGFELMTNLKGFKISTPVIVISALSGTEHVVKGLDLGAVDYIKKPFDWDELLARIRVVSKKSANAYLSKIQIEDLTIDVAARKVTRDNQEIRLTAKEFLLLEYLAQNANRVVSKNQIMENVWDLNFDPGSNIVEVHMYQLRKKINSDFEVPLIETVVGLGYTLKGVKN